LRSGDAAAFEQLLETWSGGMIRIAKDYVSTHESAREVVQETWVAVIRGINSFEGRSSLKTWVYRILINLAKRRGAQEHRTVPVSSLISDGEGPTVDPGLFRPEGEPFGGHWWAYPEPWPSPEQLALTSELRAVISEALDRLPDSQRTVINLRDILGYGSAEVCSLLEITAANQRVLLHRARASVRRSLEEYFASAAAP
jgi:RNA polymerase sigma-70 factor (ECF subfamily)